MANNVLSRSLLDIKVANDEQDVKRVGEMMDAIVGENDWEEMISIICCTLSTDRFELAKSAGLHRDTLNKGSREPKEYVIQKLWKTILQLAAEQDRKENYGLLAIFDNQTMKDAFYNSASRSSSEQKLAAKRKRQTLIVMKKHLDELKEQDQQIARRKALLEQQDRLLREKSAELEALESDEARRAQAMQVLDELNESVELPEDS